MHTSYLDKIVKRLNVRIKIVLELPEGVEKSFLHDILSSAVGVLSITEIVSGNTKLHTD